MNNKLLVIFGYLFVVLIVAGICFSEYYLYSRYKKISDDRQEWQNKYNDLIAHPEKLAKSEADLYIEKVSKLTKLPSGEIPKINTVLDISQLKDQEFFKDAANGDKILVYENSKYAVIYRPSTNKVINTGTLLETKQ